MKTIILAVTIFVTACCPLYAYHLTEKDERDLFLGAVRRTENRMKRGDIIDLNKNVLRDLEAYLEYRKFYRWLFMEAIKQSYGERLPR